MHERWCALFRHHLGALIYAYRATQGHLAEMRGN